jgi:outer membrane receptor for ferrienterochelin and colicins
MEKCLWIGFFVLVLSISSIGQGVVEGKVLNGSEPVAGATIAFGSIKKISDSTGAFYFEGINAGKYQLHVSAIGFEPYHQTIKVDKEEVTGLTIQLQSHISSLDAVVITGTMKPVQRLESPIAVEVYSPQFFKKNPSPSLFEALQNVNGVRPQINCNVCNTGDIHINGLEGPYTMVTIDGMPIVSSLSSVYGLFGIPSQLIERVEIVKGPASGLYGSEAIGGLINIITKSPDKAPKLSVNLMSTSWKEHNVDLGYRFKAGKSNSLLGLNYFNYTNPVDNNGDNFTDATLQHRISVFNKWSFQRQQSRLASLAFRYFYEDRWGGEMQWNKTFRGGDSVYGESIYTNRWEAIGNYQLPVREKLLFSFSATAHNQNSYYGTTPYMGDQKILFGQLLWDKQVGAHNGLIGVATRYNYFDDNTTATVDTLSKINQPEKYFIPSLFIQDEWKLHLRHSLLFGLRYDHHPVHKTILTPRLAYKWSLNERQVLRLNGGTGFRVVNIFPEDHAALTGARAVEIKEKLQPERSYNVNLNYTHKIGTASRSLHLDASVWYSYFRNQIIADYDTDPNKIVYDNLDGHSLSKGFTLNLELNYLNRLKGLIGVTLQDVAKVEQDNRGKEIKTRPLLTESWSGTWSLSYSFPTAGLTIDYTGNIYGPMDLPLASRYDPRKSTSPVWSIQNIQCTKWVSKNVEAFAGVKNLLNWTPAKNNAFIIARSHDPFDKQLDYDGDGATDVDANGEVLRTATNPYGLTFDPSYVYAPNQGLRVFGGVRVNIRN